MSGYISDRQRVEAALPANFMWSVVLNGADESTESQHCITLLQLAAYDSVEDIATLKGREKILRRAQRAYEQAAAPWAGEGQSVGKFGLMVYYWLRAMIEEGFITIPDGSPFEEAMEIVLPALEPHAAIEAVDRSAKKQAVKFHARLQELGFYKGVDLNGET